MVLRRQLNTIILFSIFFKKIKNFIKGKIYILYKFNIHDS